MSFLSGLSGVTSDLGRGLEDLFTLGTAELARKYGGSGANNAFGVVDKGVGANWLAGAAGGSSILGAQGLGGLGAGSAGGGGAASMGPVGSLSSAGSTLGGGMGSSLNLAPSAMGSTGAAPGVAAPAATPAWMQALQNMRSMPGSGGGQAMAKPNPMAQIYQMFPSLRPGAQLGQQTNIGGM